MSGSTGRALRPVHERPTAVVYDLKRRAIQADQIAEKAVKPAAGIGSMFFRNRELSIENDPFLQRLSRLK
ncbi:MAG: hypothetical protein ACU0C9_10590 [Paracoccaceae bacterium]